jgi:hypothetical protein
MMDNIASPKISPPNGAGSLCRLLNGPGGVNSREVRAEVRIGVKILQRIASLGGLSRACFNQF